MFVQDNRGKRAVCIDLQQDEGMEAFLRLLASADVFVTNLRARALAKLGLDYETLSERFPRLVYAMLTGYGLKGPEADSPGYDVGAYWARSGVADLIRSNDQAAPGRYPGGNGDHASGASLFTAILGGLFHRERSGRGQLVETSLFLNGIWSLATPITAWTGHKSLQFRTPHEQYYNVCLASYECKGGKLIQLLGQEPLRHFSKLMKSLGLDEVLGTEMDMNRWVAEGFKGERLMAQRRKLVALLDARFLTKTREEWARIFSEHGVWSEIVQPYQELLHDPQAAALGAFPDPGVGFSLVRSPFTFSCSEHGPRSGAPGVGQHNAEVAEELGYTAEEIANLTLRGALTTKTKISKRLDE